MILEKHHFFFKEILSLAGRMDAWNETTQNGTVSKARSSATMRQRSFLKEKSGGAHLAQILVLKKTAKTSFSSARYLYLKSLIRRCSGGCPLRPSQKKEYSISLCTRGIVRLSSRSYGHTAQGDYCGASERSGSYNSRQYKRQRRVL